MMFGDDQDEPDYGDDETREPWLRRYARPIAVFVVLTLGGATAYELVKGGSSPVARPHNETRITQVMLPPPPPPPPPPKTPPPEHQKPEEKPKEPTPTPAKAEAKPAPKAPAPPAALQTSIQGNGPSGIQSGNGGGDGTCIGAGCGNGDGTGGDNDRYYASLVKDRIQNALQTNPKLKYAKYKAVINFKLSGSGQAVGVVLASFTGDEDARAEVERIVAALNTGDTPPPAMLAKQFSVHITERARG